MKGIEVCGDCGNYDWKRHRCKIGCEDDSNAQAPFYGDCPLPDVVLRVEFAREIFEEIERKLDNYYSACLSVGAIEAYTYYDGGLGEAIAELKKKYTEGKE